MAKFQGWNHPSQVISGEERSKESAAFIPHGGASLQRAQYQDPLELYKIASEKRIIIIEGISGSGKDTLQAYLKQKLTGRDIYDFSEGEVLHSWKQIQIAGILKLRVQFMRVFVNYMTQILDRDKDAIFLLNRFHLSTYANTIYQQPKLAKEYNEIIDDLRTLPVHTFILLLNRTEIEPRSLHPERAEAWAKFKQNIVEGSQETFHARLEKQQELMLEAAVMQRIPYSLVNVKVLHDPKVQIRRVHVSQAASPARSGVQTPAPLGSQGNNHRKRPIPSTV